MDIKEREEINNFIDGLPYGLWGFLTFICSSILEFYSLKKHKFDAGSDVAFFVDLLKNEENSIQQFRDRFKIYIENNGGKFKNLSQFPEYFRPRDKKIRNLDADKIRIELLTERESSKRIELINNLQEIAEQNNDQYRPLTKNEEAEHCFYWAIHSCRFEFKNDKLKNYLGLPKATFLYGYACGLLGLDSGIYYKLNEDKTAHQQGGEILKNKAEFAKEQVIALWNDRFNNPHLKKKSKAEFGRHIYDHPELIIDENGNTLKKPNGEKYYNDPTYIERLLPKNT